MKMLIRDKGLPKDPIVSPQQVAELVCPFINAIVGVPADREVFGVIYLNAAGAPTGIEALHIGGRSASVVDPVTVFRKAIINNASEIIVWHNHPSGNMEFSPEDKVVHQQLVDAGKLLVIPVLDFVIVGDTPDLVLSRGPR